MFRSLSAAKDGAAEIRVVGVFAEDRETSAWRERRELTDDAGSMTEANDEVGRLLVVSLGARDEWGTAKARQVANAVARRLAALRVRSAKWDVPGDGSTDQVTGEIFGMLAYRNDRLRGAAAKPDTTEDLQIIAEEGRLASLGRGMALANAVNATRQWVETPPNIATPGYLAQEAKRVASDCGLDCRVIEGAELEAERLVGLMTVGGASVNKPCLIRLEYTPDKGTDEPPIVLLGKTITYDTGGLSIKPREALVGMKGDKAGGCAVLGAMQAVAQVVKPRRRVVGLLVAAENAISDNAYRPDDVITYRNGITVEVTNTDAEGRLVLADGLIWASEVEKAGEIIDLATLTGGVVIALGGTFAGIFGTDDRLVEDLREAGQKVGERLWRLPLDDEYREMMRSPVADFVNSNAGRKAHPIQGATFLEAFVPEGTPWAHLDIAGVAGVDKDKPGLTPGASGFGVRLLAAYLETK